ncbi:unnamed protein product [Acidithrix sp. C25]|nr:unnamed protein product [Acidithrix sp. C25]
MHWVKAPCILSTAIRKWMNIAAYAHFPWPLNCVDFSFLNGH